MGSGGRLKLVYIAVMLASVALYVSQPDRTEQPCHHDHHSTLWGGQEESKWTWERNRRCQVFRFRYRWVKPSSSWSRVADGYKLLSVICPHQGGEVQDEGEDVFTCDGHGWQFDKNEGVCVNQPHVRMRALPVDIEDGRLSALVRPE